MRAYIVTTGLVFGLIVVAHILRAFAEDYKPFTEPAFVFLTILALGFFTWSVLLLRRRT